MQPLINAESKVRSAIRARADEMMRADAKEQVDMIAGDVAAQVYHYLLAVAHSELAVIRAKRTSAA